MSLEALRKCRRVKPFRTTPLRPADYRAGESTLAKVARRLGTEFCRAADCIFHCRGSVIVSGIGKAGLVGQKIMATLASTGSRSHCLHPAEAVHGDLGRVHSEDVMLILSQSGETEEVLRLLPSIHEMKVPIIAITGRADSSLGKARAGGDRVGARPGGLPAGTGAEHQHDRHVGGGRCLGPGRQPDAAIRPPRILPASIRRAAWAVN